MKKSLYLLFMAVIMAGADVYPSDSDQGDDPGLFTKGAFKVDLYNPLSFKFGTYGTDGEKQYNWTDLKFKVSTDYFFLNNFGAGIKLELDREVERYPDDDIDKWSEFTLDASLIYGTSFGNFNVYLKPYVGFGTEVYKYDYEGGSSEYKYGIFRTGFEIGSPIPIGGNNRITINPKIGFRYTKYTDKEFTTDYYSDYKVYAGVGLSMFLGCEDLLCDIETGFENSNDRYLQGRNVFEYSSKLRLFNQSYKEVYSIGGETEEDKDRERGLNFKVSYKRSIFDRLFVGARISAFAESYDFLEDEATVDKQSGFHFGPVVEFHPFSKPILGNLFVEGSLGFGSTKHVHEEPAGDHDFKYSSFMYDLNTGFDYGLSDNLSLVTRIGIESEISKHKDSDAKANTTNGYFSIGTRISF